jgi:hypothetical protein
MFTWLTFVISCVALGISAVTLWLTFLKKGRLVMTQPSTVFFGPDDPNFSGSSKVYLRTLLYSTAKRGFVLESLHLSVQRNETKQTFNIWVYGERNDLVRGSGLFVPQEGVTLNHHFLLPKDGSGFTFLAGAYTLTVHAKSVGQHVPVELMTIHLSISESTAKELSTPNTGLHFDWSPDKQVYTSHVDNRTSKEAELKKLFELFMQKQTAS